MIGNIAAKCLTRWESHADGQEKPGITPGKSEIVVNEFIGDTQSNV